MSLSRAKKQQSAQHVTAYQSIAMLIYAIYSKFQALHYYTQYCYPSFKNDCLTVKCRQTTSHCTETAVMHSTYTIDKSTDTQDLGQQLVYNLVFSANLYSFKQYSALTKIQPNIMEFQVQNLSTHFENTLFCTNHTLHTPNQFYAILPFGPNTVHIHTPPPQNEREDARIQKHSTNGKQDLALKVRP